jgi:hypothetical protein
MSHNNPEDGRIQPEGSLLHSQEFASYCILSEINPGHASPPTRIYTWFFQVAGKHIGRHFYRRTHSFETG